MDDQETRTELNRLYWETDESVADIADRLDISRRALYEGIEPAPAHTPCPECGGPLGFRNRTAEENREAECPDCGREVALDEEIGAPPEAESERRAAPLSPVRPVPAGGDGPLLGLLLIVGLGLGAWLAYLIRRR